MNWTIKRISIFIGIGTISGTVLAVFLAIIKYWTGNRAFDLLFDVSYIPGLNKLNPMTIGLLFHFATCIISIGLLYFLLFFYSLEKKILAYISIMGVGSAALFFLTSLSSRTPSISNFAAWFYWVLGHIIFALVTGILIKKWVGTKNAYHELRKSP